MRHRHSRTQPVEAIADLLNDRHNAGLTPEDLAELLAELDLKIVATEVPPPTGAPPVAAAGGLVCMDGPEGCDGELTTLLDSRHVRCERHWSLFLESEGM